MELNEVNLSGCHPERSRGVWPSLVGPPFAMPDVSTSLRFARHDKKGRGAYAHVHERVLHRITYLYNFNVADLQNGIKRMVNGL